MSFKEKIKLKLKQKNSLNRRNLKTPALRWSVYGKRFENGAFGKRWRHDNPVISLSQFSSNTNPKWPLTVAFSKSANLARTGNFWRVFRVKTPFSNSSRVMWMGPEKPCPDVCRRNQKLSGIDNIDNFRTMKLGLPRCKKLWSFSLFCSYC